jgi:hypothetical protein
MLQGLNPERAKELANRAQEEVREHYRFYEKMAAPTVKVSAPVVAKGAV